MTKHLLKTFVAFVAIAAMAMGPAWGQSNSEQLFYTLDGTQTGGSANYFQSSEITQGGISWWVTGNTTENPWRIGGKSLNAVDRDIYGESSLDETITKVSLDFGALNGITVNSVTMIVASDANFADIIEQKTVSYSANSTVDVTPGAGFEWTNAYYMFTFNVSVSGSSNKYFQLKSIKFYYTSGGSTPEPEPAPAVPHTVRFASGNDGWSVMDVTAGSAAVTAPAILQNVMAGDSLVVTAPATLPGKVKSVKAVKYVAPPTLLDNTTTAWADGKYAVPAGGLTYSDAITVSGNVTLVLTDGETLTLNKGISLASGATLTIQGNGTMNVNGTNESTASTVAGTGTLVLTSGTLTAKGGNGGNTDFSADNSHGGNGGVAINGSVIVSGGTLTATGGNGGNVGEQGANNNGGAGGAAISGSVTVNSGTLTATGGNGGSVGTYGYNCNGGAGSAAISGDLTINSGTETLTNGANGQLGQYTDECSAGAGGQAVAGTVTDNR